MRRRLWLAWLPALTLLAGCDEEVRKDKDAAPRVAEAAPFEAPSAKPEPLKAPNPAAQDALKDAVAAAPLDNGRVLFDGEKPRSSATTGAGAVFAAGGSAAARRSAESLSNAPARKDTLKITEPPAPGSYAGALPAQNDAYGAASSKNGSLQTTAFAAKLAPAAAPATVNRNVSAGGSTAIKPRILCLGDSLSTQYLGYGPAMYAALTKNQPGSAVEMYAYGGSSPSWFLPKVRRIGMGNAYTPGAPNAGPTAPKIDELLKAGAVKTVIVEQGANMINWGALKQGKPGGIGGLADAAELAKTIGASGSACLWIGPPDMKGYPGSVPALVAQALSNADAALAKAVAPHCTYIKSSDKTKYSGSDGIHQDAKAGQAWASAILADPLFKIP